MLRSPAIALCFAISMALSACAGSQALNTASIADNPNGYTLSANEQDYTCKQLSGRMQIRLLAIRDYNSANSTSLASRAVQSGTATAFGGSATSADPNTAYARDVAMLQAYNNQLAAKDCKTYNLQAELQPQDYTITPTASIKPAAGPSK